MKILVIDTTGATASVSVINEKKEIVSELSGDTMSHLRKLMPMTEAVLKKSCTEKSELTHVAAAVGPGSFTGIRIGMASAMILAQAWNLPMAAVSSLMCYAEAFPGERALICPMIDARHGQVFCGAFRLSGGENGEDALPEAVKEEKIRDGVEFVSMILQDTGGESGTEKIIFCGDGAQRYASGAAERQERCTVCDPEPVSRARAAALLALRMIRVGQTTSCEEIRPVYLRKSEAERKREEKRTEKAKKQEVQEEPVFELPPADEAISYRRASERDAEAAAALDALCFRTPWSRKAFDGELDGSKDTIYIAAENSRGELIGFAGIACVLDEGEVNRVAVHPLYRARGIADRMMDLLLDAAEGKGVKIQFLEVREANRQAIALYKNHGFSVVGRRDGYYAETGENALLMRRE